MRCASVPSHRHLGKAKQRPDDHPHDGVRHCLPEAAAVQGCSWHRLLAKLHAHEGKHYQCSPSSCTGAFRGYASLGKSALSFSN